MPLVFGWNLIPTLGSNHESVLLDSLVDPVGDRCFRCLYPAPNKVREKVFNVKFKGNPMYVNFPEVGNNFGNLLRENFTVNPPNLNQLFIQLESIFDRDLLLLVVGQLENPGDYVTSIFLVEGKLRLDQGSKWADTNAFNQHRFTRGSICLPHYFGSFSVSLLNPLGHIYNRFTKLYYMKEFPAMLILRYILLEEFPIYLVSFLSQAFIEES